MNDSYKGFQSFFEIVIADTPELLEAVYRIRYQVLCVQNSFPDMNAADYPNQLEKDEYDNHACHALLRFKSSGAFVGAVRLIMNDPTNSARLFPVELNTQIDSQVCNFKTIDRSHTAEISRFVIVGQFDRRKEERRKASSEEPPATEDENIVIRTDTDRRSNDRRRTPHLSLLLMAGVMRLSVMHNITNWLSAMEPALNRLLGFYGLNFNPAGPPVNYYGIRRPYCTTVSEVLSRMHSQYYDAWEVLTECGKYDPSSPPLREISIQESIS